MSKYAMDRFPRYGYSPGDRPVPPARHGLVIGGGVLLAALVVAFSPTCASLPAQAAPQGEGGAGTIGPVRVMEDRARGVTCWYMHGAKGDVAISCLPTPHGRAR